MKFKPSSCYVERCQQEISLISFIWLSDSKGFQVPFHFHFHKKMLFEVTNCLKMATYIGEYPMKAML